MTTVEDEENTREILETVRAAVRAMPPHQFMAAGLRGWREQADALVAALLTSAPKVFPHITAARMRRPEIAAQIREEVYRILTEQARYRSRHTLMAQGRPRGKTPDSDARREEIKAYIDAHPGATLHEIAEGVFCDARTVQRYIRTLRLPATTRKQPKR